MPKIIENVQERLLAEAARQIADRGYGAVTIRSVAGACGVGVGTVYNYFPSKDILIASVLLADWKEALSRMAHSCTSPDRWETVVRGVHRELRRFLDTHQALFADSEARRIFSADLADRHKQLRGQIAAVLRPVATSDFSADFVAEALLTWTVAGKTFAELAPMFSPLFEKTKFL